MVGAEVKKSVILGSVQTDILAATTCDGQTDAPDLGPELNGNSVPSGDIHALKMLHYLRMAAMRKPHCGIKTSDEWPHWAETTNRAVQNETRKPANLTNARA